MRCRITVRNNIKRFDLIINRDYQEEIINNPEISPQRKLVLQLDKIATEVREELERGDIALELISVEQVRED